MEKNEVQELKDWILREGLKNFSLETTFNQICEILSDNFDLHRVGMGMPTLHPLIEATSLTWNKNKGFEMLESEHGYSDRDDWRKSPISYMFEKEIETLRYRLDQEGDWHRFPLLVDLAQAGCTEYYAQVISFNDVFHPSNDDTDGMLTSWATTYPDGFTDDFFEVINELSPALGIISKLTDRESAVINLVEAYLGKDAGTRVLEGQIKRGELISIDAVIWYSDLRHSTRLAESLSSQGFLDTLNTYFECTAGSILDNDGEVLRFIGDAVLAIFPFQSYGSAQIAAQSAWESALLARDRIQTINLQRNTHNQESLEFGLALHAGSLDYGNIGVPTRLEFSVIGPVANEVARLEGLTKTLGKSILVSDSFAKLLDIEWQSMGQQQMKGVSSNPVIYAPKTVQ